MNDEPKQDEAEEPDREAEPESGPARRYAAFLGERLTELRPRDQPAVALPRGLLEPDANPEVEGGPPLGPMMMTPAVLALAAPAARPGFRRDRIQQFRAAQRRKLRAAARASIQPLALAGEAPPEPPEPPPANNWIPIGPSCLRRGQAGTMPTTSGRTQGISVAPGGSRVYIAAANGGVWRSEDTGRTWVSLMNAFDLNPTTVASDSLSCGALALVPGASAATDRLYVGSGEGHGVAFFGVGPIVSIDGGVNWVTEDVSPGSSPLAGSGFFALAVDPGNPDRVVAATRVGLYRREPAPGGGFHWDRKALAGFPSATPVASVVAAASGGLTTFYASLFGGGVFRSTDGATWTQAGTGYPAANVGRSSLAVRANDPSVVYALVVRANNNHLLGVYRLDVDDGAWHQVVGVPTGLFGPFPTQPGQGWYDLAIAVAPNDENRIYIGGSIVFSGGDWSAALYRCDVTVSTSAGSITGANCTAEFIGESVHADVHALTFAPGDANKLWVGCDGGVFYSTNPTGTGSSLFEARNTGLQTLTMEHLDQHPTEDAVVFCGSQDNGGDRFTGEEAWLYSAGGDCGYFVVNWNDPYKVLNTYVFGSVRRSTNGGTRYSYTPLNVPLDPGEQVLFYAPLAGTPFNPTAPAEADLVAFGSVRPWMSTTFGGGWQSIPDGDRSDDLVGPIRALAFATAAKLYAGTLNGGVYRFDMIGAAWSRTRIDTGVATNLPLDGPITDITIDPSDPTGDSIFIAFGGTGDFRHVWHFNGAHWTARSGPSAGAATALLDVQHNALATDPAHPSHLYVGADIGIWRSTDGGGSWQPYSEGLPDAAVIDLKLHEPRRLLRASTHGRGVWERTIDATAVAGIELYVRSTQLDQGRFPVINGLDDPTQQGKTVAHWRGPDIKLDTPDALGSYQFPLSGTIDFLHFVDTLSDDFQNVATHATAMIVTRVYVQVHNRGVTPAEGVRVMLLLANASAGLPPLPPNYWLSVQSGTPISTADWQTVGITTLDDVRVGFPKIAAFSLSSSLLPPPANLAGNNHHCVLVLVHHPADPYTSTQTNTDLNSIQERKAAHKNLTVVAFTGMPPQSPAPVVFPVRIHNAREIDPLLMRLVLRLNGYRGRFGLVTSGLRFDQGNEGPGRGLEPRDDLGTFQRWAQEHLDFLERNQGSEMPYNRDFAWQRAKDVQAALEEGVAFVATGEEDEVSLGPIVMEPRSHHTLFLILERPEDARLGESFPIEVLQVDAKNGDVIGGLEVRVDFVEEPKLEKYYLRLWRTWRLKSALIRAQLFDSEGRAFTPRDGARIELTRVSDDGRIVRLREMRWHKAWQVYYLVYKKPRLSRRLELRAKASIGDREVARETIELLG